MTPEDDKLSRQLHERFDAVLEEPIPARMYLRSPRWFDYARAAVLVALGIAIGLAIPHARELAAPGSTRASNALPLRAAQAHLVYASEVRHPVEVTAAEQDHLVRWLSKRLGAQLRVPVLSAEGYELLGGRLLPSADGPVAQFMYQDASGRRLTVYVTSKMHKDPITAFRFMQLGDVSVFYWVDRDCGYAITGQIAKPELSRLATVIYKQLEDQ